MPMRPIALVRPIRIPDTEGGWTTQHKPVRALYGALQVTPFRTTVTARAAEDIRPEDLVIVKGVCYRVMARVSPKRAPFKEYELSAAAMPLIVIEQQKYYCVYVERFYMVADCASVPDETEYMCLLGSEITLGCAPV